MRPTSAQAPGMPARPTSDRPTRRYCGICQKTEKRTMRVWWLCPGRTWPWRKSRSRTDSTAAALSMAATHTNRPHPVARAHSCHLHPVWGCCSPLRATGRPKHGARFCLSSVFLQCTRALQHACVGRSLTDSLEVGELLAAGSQQRHQAPVVDGDEDDDSQGVEDGQAGGRDGEAAVEHNAVHGSSLLHEEAAHLRPPELLSSQALPPPERTVQTQQQYRTSSSCSGT